MVVSGSPLILRIRNRCSQVVDRNAQLVGLLLQPSAAAFVCGVGPIRQRHDDVGVYQNHDERSAAEAVSKQVPAAGGVGLVITAHGQQTRPGQLHISHSEDLTPTRYRELRHR